VILDDEATDRGTTSLLRELRALFADLPIVLASTRSPEELMRQFGEDRHVAVIAKPYKVETLYDTLRSLGIVRADRED
jgi:CheY-like chemotaxis protein